MKKHDILNRIESDLSGIHQTCEVTIRGVVYGLKLLSRSEEIKAQSMVTEDTIIAAYAASNLPQVALALTHIDNVPVKELFSPETDEEKKANEIELRGKKLTEWLGARPAMIAERLFIAYLDMKSKYYEALEEGVENLSETIPSGE